MSSSASQLNVVGKAGEIRVAGGNQNKPTSLTLEWATPDGHVCVDCEPDYAAERGLITQESHLTNDAARDREYGGVASNRRCAN